MTQPSAQSIPRQPADIPAVVPNYRVLELAIELLKFLGILAFCLGVGWLILVLMMWMAEPKGHIEEYIIPTFLPVLGGALGVILGQCCECLRDTARNSFYMRRELALMGNKVQ